VTRISRANSTKERVASSQRVRQG